MADKSSSARSTSNRIRVLVVDDFPAWRAQIRRILRARLKWAIISEARDGSQAVEKATELRPDIVLLDVGLPRVNGIEATKTIRQVSPDSKIIFVTLDGSDDMMRAALATGANGYVLKQNAARELIPAVKTALGNPQ